MIVKYSFNTNQKEQLDEFRKDPNYFVSVMGNVYKNDTDYAFKRMQRRFKKTRDSYKYLGWKVEAELINGLEKLIKEKESSITKLKNDKEMLIEANGNLLLKVPQAKEEESFFEDGRRDPKGTEPFDFRSVFENGKFKR